jgi:glutaredoxin
MGAMTLLPRVFGRTPDRRPDRRPEPAAAPAAGRLVTLIGRPGCHLCDDARRVIAEACAELGAAWEEKDITRDPELHRRYWEQIPVVLVDGEQHDFWRVDPGRLRRALGASPDLD